jgi:hypothetical protein
LGSPQAQRDGLITRDNSLGLLKLANWFWPEMLPNNDILLGASVKNHEFYRPYLDWAVGEGKAKNWNSAALLESAKKHLRFVRERGSDLDSAPSLKVFNDIKIWTTMEMFKGKTHHSSLFTQTMITTHI